VYLVGFIIRKFVTRHGHMNVKNRGIPVAGSDLVLYMLISGFLRGGCISWAPPIVSRKEIRSVFSRI
jgi:hypothetical protein